jgi:hypothetical protein
MDATCVTMADMKRDAVLNVRLPADVKEALRRAAEDDFDRSVSGMVVRVMREWLESQGYLAGAPGDSKSRKKTKTTGRG